MEKQTYKVTVKVDVVAEIETELTPTEWNRKVGDNLAWSLMNMGKISSTDEWVVETRMEVPKPEGGE